MKKNHKEILRTTLNNISANLISTGIVQCVSDRFATPTIIISTATESKYRIDTGLKHLPDELINLLH